MQQPAKFMFFFSDDANGQNLGTQHLHYTEKVAIDLSREQVVLRASNNVCTRVFRPAAPGNR